MIVTRDEIIELGIDWHDFCEITHNYRHDHIGSYAITPREMKILIELKRQKEKNND